MEGVAVSVTFAAWGCTCFVIGYLTRRKNELDKLDEQMRRDPPEPRVPNGRCMQCGEEIEFVKGRDQMADHFCAKHLANLAEQHRVQMRLAR